MRKEDNPSLSLLPSPGRAAAEPGARPDAGQVTAPGGGLDARYEQLRHAALHTRAEAFPLGFAVLTRHGVTGWRRAVTQFGSTAAIPALPPSTVPAPIAAELVDALAGLALAGTRPTRPAHSNLLRER